MPQGWLRVQIRATAYFMLMAFLVATLSAQKSDVTFLMQAGSQKVQAGDLEGAIVDFRQAAALQPSDPNVLFALAQALGDQRSFAESEQTYLKLFPIYDQLQSRGSMTGVTYKPSLGMAWNNIPSVY